jgi:hypothetical protein
VDSLQAVAVLIWGGIAGMCALILYTPALAGTLTTTTQTGLLWFLFLSTIVCLVGLEGRRRWM